MEIVDEAAKKLSPNSLPVPSVMNALVIRGGGDPKGIIKEAVYFRSLAKELRSYLENKLREIEQGTFDWHAKVNEEIETLSLALDEKLHPRKRPHLGASLQVQLTPPFVSANLNFDYVQQFVKSRKHIVVLTELSKAAASTYEESYEFKKLLSRCCSKTK